MTDIVKVSCFPQDGTPQVVAGTPVTGDIVRITTNNGTVIYERYTVPAAPPTPSPAMKTQAVFEEWAIARLGSVAAWQSLLEQCAAHTGTADNDKMVRYFPRWTQINAVKTKAEFQTMVTPLTLTTTPIITTAAMNAALAAW